jgi:protein phosphatase 1 regulatory subunit 21
LKNAFIEEKNKVAISEDTIRNRDQNLRRAESEIDSVNFRNKQLEQRVLSLQNDLQNQRKENGNNKLFRMSQRELSTETETLSNELQQKIIENGQLISLVRTHICKKT